MTADDLGRLKMDLNRRRWSLMTADGLGRPKMKLSDREWPLTVKDGALDGKMLMDSILIVLNRVRPRWTRMVEW